MAIISTTIGFEDGTESPLTVKRGDGTSERIR